MPTHQITTNDLLHGLCYAVEQAGYLLQDALTLYGTQRYAGAAALAVLCQEEIGRAHLFQAQRRKLLPSGMMSADELANLCKDHVLKLNWGEITSDFPGRNLSLKEMNKIAQQKRKAMPDQLNTIRHRSLYVDYLEDKGQWNRPSEMPESECTSLLRRVEANYNAYSRVALPDDSEVWKSTQQWTERPYFPKPVWPK